MLFGNKSVFAIEAMIEPDLKPPTNAWGRMCIWCNGLPIGDYNDEHCGLEAFQFFAILLTELDSLWLSEFDGMTDLQLWNYLDGLLYGYRGDKSVEDNRTLDQTEGDSARYSKFNFLTNWGEMFDQAGKSFIFHTPEGGIKILNRDLPPGHGIALLVPKEVFQQVTTDALSWFSHQKNILR